MAKISKGGGDMVNLLYVCGGEGYCELLANLADFLFIVHAIFLLFLVHP